jgi:hypothetical protein
MAAGKGELNPDGLPVIDNETLQAWMAQALAEPPKVKDWAELVVQLRWAVEIERRGHQNAKLPPGMTATEYQLRAVVRFLDQQPALKPEKAPLGRLLGAIGDLAHGLTSPMLKPVVRPARRPEMAQIEAMIRGLAAKALSLLMAAGQAKEQASRRIAAVLGERPETIRAWHQSIGRSRPTSPLSAEHYWAALPPEAGDAPALQAEFLLSRLHKHASSLRAAQKVA